MNTTLKSPAYNLTAELFSELAHDALTALLEDSDVFEAHDIRVWRQKFAHKINTLAEERGDELESGATRANDAEEGES